MKLVATGKPHENVHPISVVGCYVKCYRCEAIMQIEEKDTRGWFSRIKVEKYFRTSRREWSTLVKWPCPCGEENYSFLNAEGKGGVW